MRCRPSLAALLLFSAACSGSDPEIPVSILSFTASPTSVASETASELSWSVENATAVTITGGSTFIERTEQMGSISTGALSQTTTFTLTAKNGSSSASETVTVTVETSSSSAVVDRFTATSTSIRAGESTELIWFTTGADRVNISDGSANVVTGGPASGTFEISPTATTTYSLVAFAADGSQSPEASLTVDVAQPVAIIYTFGVGARIGVVGSTLPLRWGAANIDNLEIVDSNGALVISTTISAGWVDVDLNDALQDFTLTASNQYNSVTATAAIQADIPPTIDSFEATPQIGEAPFTVRLNYVVSDARRVVLNADGQLPLPFVPDGTAQTVSQSTTVMTSTSTQFTLTVVNAAGLEEQTIVVLAAEPGTQETEPNNTFDVAEVLPGGRVQRAGTISPGDDEDWYIVTATTGGFIRAALSDGFGGCAFNARLTIYESDGTTEVASASQALDTSCPVIDPNTTPAVRNMSAGTYYVVVTSEDSGGPYIIDIETGAPGCGNGVFEFEIGETCEDGNTVSGDGCSDICSGESIATYAAPGAEMTLAAPLSAAGNGFIRIDVSADTYLRAEAFTNVATADCLTIDPRFDLYDDNGVLLGSDEDDGNAACPRFDEADAFAFLTPGSYLLRIREAGGASVTVQTVIEGVAANVCGNGLLEDEALEGCDDGNTTSNDGCSGTCGTERFEGAGNDTRLSAPMLLPTGGRVTVRGQISPSTDVDYFGFNLPVGGQVLLQTYGGSGNLNSCFGNTLLTLENTFGTEVVQDDNDGSGFCSLISGDRDFQVRNLAPGRYFVRVESANSSFTQYLLDIVAL